MPEALFLTLALLTFLLWTVLIKAHLWLVYGMATYRPFSVARLSFKLALVLALITLLTALIGPWVLMAREGARGAAFGFVPLSLITLALLVIVGAVIQRAEPLFFNLERVRVQQVKAARKAIRSHAEVIENWAQVDEAERARFLDRYHGLAPHRREALFNALLLRWPRVDRHDVPKRPGAHVFPLDHVQQWGGAHFLHHPETLLTMLAERGDQPFWDGPLPADGKDRLHPELRERVLFAHTENDHFIIAPAG